MKEDLQNMIEDYLIGNLNESEKNAFERLLETDSEILEAFEKTMIVKEALLRSNVKNAINAARNQINSSNRTDYRLFTIIGTFAAAASLFLILISTPVNFETVEFKTRGAKENYAGDEISKLTDEFEIAQKNIKENQDLTNAINILNRLQSDSLVSEAYQLQSRWLLVNAYLKNNEPENAEKFFKSINCNENCPFSAWDKIKVQWQIFWKKLI